MAFRLHFMAGFLGLVGCTNLTSNPFVSRPMPSPTLGHEGPLVIGKHHDFIGFSSVLTPRKNYDLMAEMAAFRACKKSRECLITNDRALQLKVMIGTKAPQFFIWVIRPSGQLIIGSGPDEKISHGVLASVDLTDTDLAVEPMGNIYAGGEGYYEPATNTLYLNNKSGHYRPEYIRIANPVVLDLFQSVLQNRVIIKTIDQTKPRIEVY